MYTFGKNSCVSIIYKRAISLFTQIKRSELRVNPRYVDLYSILDLILVAESLSDLLFLFNLQRVVSSRSILRTRDEVQACSPIVFPKTDIQSAGPFAVENYL